MEISLHRMRLNGKLKRVMDAMAMENAMDGGLLSRLLDRSVFFFFGVPPASFFFTRLLSRLRTSSTRFNIQGNK